MWSVHFSAVRQNIQAALGIDIYFSQVKVRFVKGQFEVVEEVWNACHPPVLQQIHRPQDKVDSLAVLVPGPVYRTGI